MLSLHQYVKRYVNLLFFFKYWSIDSVKMAEVGRNRYGQTNLIVMCIRCAVVGFINWKIESNARNRSVTFRLVVVVSDRHWVVEVTHIRAVYVVSSESSGKTSLLWWACLAVCAYMRNRRESVLYLVYAHVGISQLLYLCFKQPPAQPSWRRCLFVVCIVLHLKYWLWDKEGSRAD